MADSQRSDVFVLESESQLFNSIISQELNERDSDDEQSSLQSQQMMQGDQTMNTSASSEAQDVNSIDVLEVIVNEVQAHPILWSRQNPDYKRGASEVKVEEFIRWFQEMPRQEERFRKNGSGYSKQPTCRFYNQLLFLRDSISNRTTQSNVQVRSISLAIPSPSEKALPEPSTHAESNPGNKASQQNQQHAVPPTAQPPAKQKFQFPQATVIPKKKKKVVLDPVEEYLIKSIEKNEEENKLVPAKKEDADEQFCQSITHTLRRLGEQSVKKNQLAKIKIQQLLFDIEFDD
ncbi:uncharacterized protein LOC108916950 [Paramuricea clavata]|uniref:Uncharacterized protein LOC108916950 n=1 Tax=Paramuricea clavata TaxID=317549 RepID=A0A6S7IJW6_PARCT|nr:uncharacterized protein LOC108916950 [Paramuricea clavata]